MSNYIPSTQPGPPRPPEHHRRELEEASGVRFLPRQALKRACRSASGVMWLFGDSAQIAQKWTNDVQSPAHQVERPEQGQTQPKPVQ